MRYETFTLPPVRYYANQYRYYTVHFV